MLLLAGTTAGNADQARKLGILRPTDRTVYHPDLLATEAKRLAMQAEATPPIEWNPVAGLFGGMMDQAVASQREKGDLTDHDLKIGSMIKQIFRAASYEDALRLEREEFVELCSKPHTQARIRHMLDTGKPLRN